MTPVPDSGFSFPPHEPQEPATALLGGATDLIEAFSLRMARHGMSVSRRMMLADPTYARQQAAHAHAIDDPLLVLMALELVRQFEADPSVFGRLH
ncbi:MAG: hypothetical protein C0451_14435 [Comamonadaceae bacterium]|jgi:hypothetical protein|nr:hypothetical protein [Comamonadaceae bacterium]